MKLEKIGIWKICDLPSVGGNRIIDRAFWIFMGQAEFMLKEINL